MIDLLKTLVEPLVDNINDVRIDQMERGNTVVLEVRVNPEDMGRLIGRRGRRAQAIRSVMRAKAKLENKRVIVDIVDPE
ncbi:MAG TPA: KH domain-containing protein [Clostridiaceae bacterium]|nr:KH domain-containing protein [Clostridiaceae bacterium]